MSKQILIALAVVASVFGWQQPLRAAEATNAPAPAGAARLGALRERMQETARELNLTEEQTQKLQAIVRERLEKLRELREDAGLSREEKIAKVKAVRDEITAEVKKVLTPEQFEKWQAKQGPAAGAADKPGARVRQAIKELNLTDAQRERLKPVYEEQAEKLRTLYLDSSLSITEKLEKLNAMRREVAPKFKQVLDAEQYARWEKEVNRWLEQLKQRFQQQ